MQPLRLDRQLVGQLGRGERRVGVQQRRGDLQRQRQPPADLGQPRGGLPVPCDPVVTGPGRVQRRLQQRDARLAVQDRDVDQPGAQPGQGMPRGHQHLVRPVAGQQQPDLRLR